MEKFAKLSSTKLISLLIHQTLIPPNFRRLPYMLVIRRIQNNYNNCELCKFKIFYSALDGHCYI